MQPGFVIGDRGLAAAGDTHPLWMTGHGMLGDYRIVGASAVGQFHLQRELPRDDAFVVRSCGAWIAVAVSDGVGSRPHSRFGATYVAEALTTLLLRPLSGRLVVDQAGADHRGAVFNASGWLPPAAPDDVEFDATISRSRQRHGIPAFGALQKKLVGHSSPQSERNHARWIESAASTGWGGWQLNPPQDPAPEAHAAADLVAVMQQGFVKTHLGLREHATGIGLELADLGCTALALLINVVSGRGVAGQVGDGAVLGLTAQGRVRELVEAAETDDPQAVFTINRPTFQDHLTIQLIEPLQDDLLTAYFVMTDGVSSDILYSPDAQGLDRWGEAVVHNLRAATSAAQAGAAALHWLATYKVKGSWDDRTLVVITQCDGDDGRR